jgi:hypothetical protein
MLPHRRRPGDGAALARPARHCPLRRPEDDHHVSSPADRVQRGGQVGCIAGAPSFAECRDGLAVAGFTDITITPAHQVAVGVHSAIIRAARP